MTPSEIQACLERANEVINGFKKPSERNARDVVSLIKHYNSKPDSGSAQHSKAPDMPDFIKDLFGFK